MWSHQTQLVGIYIYICGGPCVLLMAHGSTKLVRAHTHTTLAGRKIERERERTWTSVSCFQLTARAGSAASKRGESWSMRDRPGLERSSSETHGPRETGGEA